MHLLHNMGGLCTGNLDESGLKFLNKFTHASRHCTGLKGKLRCCASNSLTLRAGAIERPRILTVLKTNFTNLTSTVKIY